MSDTSRGLSWAVERACALRRDPDWRLPVVAHRELFDLVAFDEARGEDRVLEGVCVTGESSYGAQAPGLPSDGFFVDAAMAPFGGEPRARATCSGCEANVPRGVEASLAGCHGYLNVPPDSPDLDEELRLAAKGPAVAAPLSKFFVKTKPIWYGLWVDSPLDRDRMESLTRLFDASSIQWRDYQGGDHFLRSLRAAAQHGLRLHVLLHPPAHFDFDHYTVFAHCPRCKAEAPFDRWHPYPTEPHKCTVCGNVFNPAASTMAQLADDLVVPDRADLKTQMGVDAWTTFTRHWLLHKGYTASDIARALRRPTA